LDDDKFLLHTALLVKRVSFNDLPRSVSLISVNPA
jgi:hypothetical protein